MVTTKQMNIKDRTYHFYNDLINIKDFDPMLLKLDKKLSKNIGVYYIGYTTKKMSLKLIVQILFIYLSIEQMVLLRKKKKVILEY